MRLLRRCWLRLRWDIGPAVTERALDRLRARQQIALKRRQKRIEARWEKDEDEGEAQ